MKLKLIRVFLLVLFPVITATQCNKEDNVEPYQKDVLKYSVSEIHDGYSVGDTVWITARVSAFVNNIATGIHTLDTQQFFEDHIGIYRFTSSSEYSGEEGLKYFDVIQTVGTYFFSGFCPESNCVVSTAYDNVKQEFVYTIGFKAKSEGVFIIEFETNSICVNVNRNMALAEPFLQKGNLLPSLSFKNCQSGGHSSFLTNMTNDYCFRVFP